MQLSAFIKRSATSLPSAVLLIQCLCATSFIGAIMSSPNRRRTRTPRKPRRERKSIKPIPPTRRFSDLLVISDPRGELAAQLTIGARVRVACIHSPDDERHEQRIQFVTREKTSKSVSVKMARLTIVKREGESLEDSMSLYPITCIEDDVKIGSEVPVVGGAFYVYKTDYIIFPPDILGLGSAREVGYWRIPITLNIECPLTERDWFHLKRLMPNVVEEYTFSDHLNDFFSRREQKKDQFEEEEEESELEEEVLVEVAEALKNATRKPEVRDLVRREQEGRERVLREEDNKKKENRKEKVMKEENKEEEIRKGEIRKEELKKEEINKKNVNNKKPRRKRGRGQQKREQDVQNKETQE